MKELRWFSEIDDTLWVGVAVDYATHVDTSLHLEIALISPERTPGILDNPVVHAIFNAVSNCYNCMVHCFYGVTADSRGENPASIIQKVILCIKTNSNGSMLVKCE